MNRIKHIALAAIFSQFAALSAQSIVDSGAVDTAPIFEPTRVEMRFENNEIVVTGMAGAPVALLVGLEKGSFHVGRAHIRLMPLMILDLGRIDESGEYRWRLGDEAQGEAFTFLIQAVSVNELGLAASGLWEGRYHGGISFDAVPVPEGEDDTHWLSERSSGATRVATARELAR